MDEFTDTLSIKDQIPKLKKKNNEVPTGYQLSDAFPIQNGLKQGNTFITIAFQLSFKICHWELNTILPTIFLC
jgi:hypothetical protein